MGMNDFIFRMLLKESAQFSDVTEKGLWGNPAHMIYPSTKPFDFLVKFSGLGTVSHKIELNHRSVNVSVNIHQPVF